MCVHVLRCNVAQMKKALIDENGLPYFKSMPNTIGSFQNVLEGFPVVVNDDLSDDTLIFGDFSKFHVRMVGGVTLRVLNELYALQNAIAIVGHAAIDSDCVDTTAFGKLVVTPA